MYNENRVVYYTVVVNTMFDKELQYICTHRYIIIYSVLYIVDRTIIRYFIQTVSFIFTVGINKR